MSPERSHDCDFCDIAAGREPARVVCETPRAMAFFPLNPATEGHTLLIPKRHIPDLWSLDQDTAVALAKLVVPISAAIRVAVNPDGFNVINSAGEAATQTVFHLHFHLVPRWFDDHIGDIWPPKQTWKAKEQNETLAEIRRALDQTLEG